MLTVVLNRFGFCLLLFSQISLDDRLSLCLLLLAILIILLGLFVLLEKSILIIAVQEIIQVAHLCSKL